MPVTPHKITGYKAQLGYGVTTAGVTTYTIVAGLTDLNGKFTAEALDATDHGSNGWKETQTGLLHFSGTAKLQFIEGDTTQQFLRSQLLANAPFLITMYPEQTAAGSGEDSYQGSVVITDWSWDAKNTSLQDVSVTLEGAGAFTVVSQ